MFNFLFKSSEIESEINENVKPNSVASYLINLDRAKERLSFVKDNIEKIGLPFHRISAVDGNLLSNEEIEKISDRERYKRYFKMFPEKGTIGCSLSHKKVWEEFLKSEYEFALVFEDDVTFDPIEMKICVEEVIKKKNIWDIVSFEILHNGWPIKISNLHENKFLVIYLANVTHSGCYIINKRAARRFLEKFYPISMGLDHYITASWEFDLKFLGVEPRIVCQKFGNSQIKISKAEKFTDINTKISNAMYNIRRAVVHFLYNFLVRSY